jgi:hypothetical protein
LPLSPTFPQRAMCSVICHAQRDRLLEQVVQRGPSTQAVKQIVFEGERFDVMSVRRWREKLLGQ